MSSNNEKIPNRGFRKVKKFLIDIALVLAVAGLLLFAQPNQAGAVEPANEQGGNVTVSMQEQAPVNDEKNARFYAIPKTADYALPTLAIVAGLSAGGLLFLAHRNRNK